MKTKNQPKSYNKHTYGLPASRRKNIIRSFSCGIPCPNCGFLESQTTDTRPRVGRIYRRRVCLKCAFRFTTAEVVVQEGLIIDFQI